MNVEITRRFEKEADKLSKTIQNTLADLIDEVEKAENLTDVAHLKKLVGFENAYLIRIGDYRVGILVDESTVTFCRILHRREIYRYFP